MKLIAHRGKLEYHDIGNNKQSFLNALSKSYISGIECDVRLTKDLEVVVIHDPVIDFVSDGNGIVNQMTLEELKQYQFGNDSILTLKELLRQIHSDKLIIIELKGERNDFRLVDAVDRTIRMFPNLHFVIVSFWEPLLKYAKKINHDIELGILIGYFFNHDKMYNHFDYNLFSYHYLDQIYMHKKLMYFTINKEKQIEKIKKKYEDVYVITDCATRLQNLVEK